MSDKAALFKDYLSQQVDNVFINGLLDPDNIQMHSSRLPVHDQNDDNDDNEFETFKAIVKYYIKTDNEIKDIKSKVKLLHSETKKRQKILESVSPTIMEFMSKNDIDELNSKDGVINPDIIRNVLTGYFNVIRDIANHSIHKKIITFFVNKTVNDINTSLTDIVLIKSNVDEMLEENKEKSITRNRLLKMKEKIDSAKLIITGL